jgi:predicted trehalose synthase
VEACGDAAFQLRGSGVVHVLENAVCELSYDLNNQPDWVDLPLRGIADLVGRDRGKRGSDD